MKKWIYWGQKLQLCTFFLFRTNAALQIFWYFYYINPLNVKNSLYGLSPHFYLNFYDQTSYTKLKIK